MLFVNSKFILIPVEDRCIQSHRQVIPFCLQKNRSSFFHHPVSTGIFGFLLYCLAGLLPVAASDWEFVKQKSYMQALCQKNAKVPIPPADRLGMNHVSGGNSCDSGAYYYGYGGSRDFVTSRLCAYREYQDIKSSWGEIMGSAVLSMIYANGLGVPRNMPLAIRFACEAGGAPAETVGRVLHLEAMRQQTAARKTLKPFDFCNDITSGVMGGACEMIASDLAAEKRDKALVKITANFNAQQSNAYKILRSKSKRFYESSAENEQDMSGTAHASFYLSTLESLDEEFLVNMRWLVSQKLPLTTVNSALQTDKKLNKVWRKLLKEGTDPKNSPGLAGEVTIDNVRASQRLWVTYRDAWIRFATLLRPDLPREAVFARITQQRIESLQQVSIGE
ncbi:lysozyme inhibitor LprI family protein [Acidithiobacillus sp.]|uniref:lysozyme inhibitor LprI family protein n=1 Tax=Acidithiobacillus sp. TaxID=1872118 RepID=UPI002633900A|nr:lysozyme inhibitor LprI family protein [Acidithiobacillus sp.]MDD2750548.1 DUF1311 domain-containing protein [Acidithiobacillus sp.]MDD5279195.1 DUF1311 domain-containing protein [Acidithiobacillus sp.]